MLTAQVYLHAGSVGASDASTKDEWGAHVGEWVARGMWEPATLAAIEQSRKGARECNKVSISPLELPTVALMVVVAGHTAGTTIRTAWALLEQAGIPQLFLRCDNLGSVSVVESHRAHSAPMRAALEILEKVERLCGLKIRLEHIVSDENVVTDALSHNKLDVVANIFKRAGATLRTVPQDEIIPAIGMPLHAVASAAEQTVREAYLSGLKA